MIRSFIAQSLSRHQLWQILTLSARANNRTIESAVSPRRPRANKRKRPGWSVASLGDRPVFHSDIQFPARVFKYRLRNIRYHRSLSCITYSSQKIYQQEVKFQKSFCLNGFKYARPRWRRTAVDTDGDSSDSTAPKAIQGWFACTVAERSFSITRWKCWIQNNGEETEETKISTGTFPWDITRNRPSMFSKYLWRFFKKLNFMFVYNNNSSSYIVYTTHDSVENLN